DRLPGRLRLRLTDVGLAVDDLPLQVGLVDLVELRDSERADPGRGQVQQGGAAETAGADHEHPGVLQPLLAGHPDVGDDQVPAVAAHLVDGQFGGGLHGRWQGHGSPLDVWAYGGRTASYRCVFPSFVPTMVTGVVPEPCRDRTPASASGPG